MLISQKCLCVLPDGEQSALGDSLLSATSPITASGYCRLAAGRTYVAVTGYVFDLTEWIHVIATRWMLVLPTVTASVWLRRPV